MAFDRNLLRQFVGFAGVGIIATAIQYGVLVIAVEWLDINAVLGSSVGFVVSAVVNYLLNYHFTFRSENAHLVAASRFAIVASCGLALNAAVMALLAQRLLLPYLIAQLVATAVVMIWNFLGFAFWTFAAQRRQPRDTILGGRE